MVRKPVNGIVRSPLVRALAGGVILFRAGLMSVLGRVTVPPELV